MTRDREPGEDDGDDTPAIDLAALLEIDRRAWCPALPSTPEGA